MKTIPLTRGLVAQVDDEDYEELSQYKWHADKAGNSFRAQRCVRNSDGSRGRILMHRQVLGLNDSRRCDHRDLDELNNQKSNLRIASNSQNGANRKGWGKSGLKGVSWNPSCKHWTAYIRKDYKRIFLGCYDDKTEAARAYDSAAKELHGDFARLNFSEAGSTTR